MIPRLSKWVLLFLLIFSIPFSVAAAIDINAADLAELKTLQGIGDVKAQAIINYRETNGLFKTIEEIKNVSGIGEVTFTNIKDQIIIGSVAIDTEDNNQIDDSNNTATSTNLTSVVVAPSLSSHSSQVTINFALPDTELVVSAGRERLTVVNQPINFEAEIAQGKNTNRGGIFTWTFGDGGSDSGRAVTHSYQVPGTYNVVLNAEVSGHQSVSRTKVTVIEPELSISRSMEYEAFLISNNNQNEINIGDWVVKAGSKEFRIPEDTIITGNQAILLADTVSGLNGNQAIIYPQDYNIKKQENFESGKVSQSLSEDEIKHLTVVLADSLVKVRQMEKQIKTSANVQTVVSNNSSSRQNSQLAKSSSRSTVESSIESTTQSDNLAGVVVLGQESGILQKITEWPVSSWYFLKQVFTD